MTERLIEAIGYPDRAPAGAQSATFRVDGMEIRAEETGGELVLSYRLAGDDSALAQLAGWAAGRILREDAALTAEPSAPGAFLWQSAPADAEPRSLARLFETFLGSCDWWRERIEALRGDAEAAPAPEQMYIRP